MQNQEHDKNMDKQTEKREEKVSGGDVLLVRSALTGHVQTALAVHRYASGRVKARLHDGHIVIIDKDEIERNYGQIEF